MDYSAFVVRIEGYSKDSEIALKSAVGSINQRSEMRIQNTSSSRKVIYKSRFFHVNLRSFQISEENTPSPQGIVVRESGVPGLQYSIGSRLNDCILATIHPLHC